MPKGPFNPTEFQLEMAELIGKHIGHKVDPHSIYPVLCSEVSRPTEEMVTLQITFNYNAHDHTV